MRSTLLLSLAVALVCPNGVCAQKGAPPVGEIGGANLPAQRIGANDLIAVQVYDAPELTRTIRVSNEGEIRLPMLHQRLRAQGVLPSELELIIAAALEQEKILVEPVVTVTMVEYHSRPISVAGAVRKPLTFQAIGRTTLLDAITRAEGLSPESGPEILVSRPQTGVQGETTTLMQRISVKSLMDDADPELNLLLVGGEEIRIPEMGKVFVVGNVKHPGAFAVQDASGTTVLKLLALAEGLLPYTNRFAYIYRREAGGSAKNEIAIEISKIIDRKASDVPLQANDILYIPDNKNKRMTMSAIDRIASFGSSTASGLLIWKR